METTMVTPRARARGPAAALGKLAIAVFVMIALDLISLQAALIGSILPPLVVFVVLSLIFACAIALGSYDGGADFRGDDRPQRYAYR